MLSYAFDISGFLENIENCDFGSLFVTIDNNYYNNNCYIFGAYVYRLQWPLCFLL